ncbi:CE1759 family FMN reductase [Brevibacterium jeotgali]|uniref:NADPH-dependent FMN reductase n=1 Tax=Brevibacterium jeotgali TaxID=1262550 RepID=A0A2H1L448_9MICO|nr:CE1759 family FMN reductase [Brevibacterium jeotgali]TWC02391.1 LLM-partnered FMN reductase [Brevibacterium jeotgali]SMY11183.1 NADPH-dependent FMN reductase [Brevibacterium jeotgali]
MIEIVAVSTGLSEDSTTTRLAQRMLASTEGAFAARGAEVTTTHINVRTLAKALVDLTVSGFPARELEEAFAAVKRASAVITVAPVYKAAPAGIHTLFWQLIDDASLAGTPVLLGGTGGTPRHSLAAESTLRPMIAYLKGYALPTSVFAATDDWGGGEQAGLDRRITQATDELAELALALNPAAVGTQQDTVAEAASGARLTGTSATGAPQAEGSAVEASATDSDAYARDIPYAGPAEESGRSAITPRGLGDRAREERGRDEFDPASVTPFSALLGG